MLRPARKRERERSLLLLLLPATRALLIHLLSLYLWNSSLRDENRPTHARTNATGTTTPGIIFGETGLNRGPFFAGPPFSLRFLYTGLVHALICRASIFVNHSTLSRLIERNMTISPQSSKSLYLAILSKVFWKTGGGEKEKGGKDKEFIPRLFVRIRCLSSWKACSVFACQRSPRSDPARCITWLPVPLEKVKVRGLVFILFAASPPGGSTSQGCSPLSLTLLPFFPPILDPFLSIGEG